MRKTCLFLITLYFAISTTLFAQSKSAASVDNVVKINPLSFVVQTVSVFYERKIADNKSIQLGLLYTGFGVDGTDYSGFGITPEYRYYFSGDGAPSGWFLGPYVRYQNLTLEREYSDFFSGTTTTSKDKYTLDSFGGGVVIGRQWVFSSGVSLEFFLGPNYSGGTLKAKSTNSGNTTVDLNGAFDGFGLRAGVTVGYGF